MLEVVVVCKKVACGGKNGICGTVCKKVVCWRWNGICVRELRRRRSRLMTENRKEN